MNVTEIREELTATRAKVEELSEEFEELDTVATDLKNEYADAEYELEELERKRDEAIDLADAKEWERDEADARLIELEEMLANIKPELRLYVDGELQYTLTADEYELVTDTLRETAQELKGNIAQQVAAGSSPTYATGLLASINELATRLDETAPSA